MTYKIPVKDPFFQIQNYPEIRKYRHSVKNGSEPFHKKITDTAIKNLQNKDQVQNQKKSNQSSKGWQEYIKDGKELVTKVGKKVITTFNSIFYLKSTISDKLKIHINNKLKTEKERHLNNLYLKKIEWINTLKKEFGTRNKNVKIDQLERLIKSDISRSIAATLQQLSPYGKTVDALSPIQIDQIGSTIETIISQTKEGNFKKARTYISQILKKVNDSKIRNLLRQLDNDLKFVLDKKLNITQSLISHDIKQIIEKSPILDLEKMKESLERGAIDWVNILSIFKENLTKDNNTSTLQLFETIEKLIKEKKISAAINKINQIQNNILNSLFKVIHEFSKIDYIQTEELLEKKAKHSTKSIVSKNHKRFELDQILLYTLESMNIKDTNTIKIVNMLKNRFKEKVKANQIALLADLKNQVLSFKKKDKQEKLYNIISSYNEILETDNKGTLPTKVIDTLQAAINKENPTKPLLEIFDEIKTQSDKMFFKNLADTLENEGVEAFINQYTTSASDKSSVPSHLRRIFKFLVSPEGQKQINEAAAKKIMKAVMGKENLNVKQEDFNKKMNELLDQFLVKSDKKKAIPNKLKGVLGALNKWFFDKGLEKITEKKVFKPLLEKIDKNGLENLFDNWFSASKKPLSNKNKTPTLIELQDRIRSANGIATFGKVLIKQYAKSVNGTTKAPTIEETRSRHKTLSNRLALLGEGPNRIKNAIVDVVIQKLKEEKRNVKKGDVILNVREFLFQKEPGSVEEKPLIHLTKIGPIVIALNEEDFKLSLEIAIMNGLIQGNAITKNAADDPNKGFDFVCDLAKDACDAMREHIDNPNAKVDLSADKAAVDLAKKLFGEKGENIGFTPFVHQIVMEIMAPGSVGAIPFKLLGEKPIGPALVENIYQGHIYKEMFDDILASKMKDEIKSLVKGGNIYSWIIKGKRKSSKKIEMSKKEKLFHQSIGSLAFDLFQEVNPDWAANIEALQKKNDFINGIGDVMIPVLREYFKEKMGVENPQEITVDNMYDYALRKGAIKLEKFAKDEETSDEVKKTNQEMAIKNLGLIAEFAEPFKKHKGFAGIIMGAIGHFLMKITLDPLIWLLGKIVEGFCKVSKKDFKKTLWYKLTVGRRQAHMKKMGRELYRPLRDIVQSENLWKRIHGKMLKRTKAIKA